MINEQEQNVNERELLVPQLGKNCDVSNFAILSSLKPSSKTQYWPRPDISAVVDKTLCNIDEDIEKKIEQLKKELLTPKEEVQKLLNMIELNGSGSFLDIVDKVESLVKRIEYTLANVYDLAVDGFGIKSILRLFTNEIGNIELLLRVCSRIPFTAPFCVPAREIVQSIRLFFDEIISVIDSMINTEEFLINVSPVLSTLQDIRVEVIKIHKVVEKNTVQILKYGGFLTPVNDIAKKINAIVATFVRLLEDLVAVPTSFIGKTLDKVQFALDLVPQAKSSSSKVRKVIVDIDRYWGMTLRPFLKKINDVLDKKIEVGRIAANARESLRKKCVQGLVGPCKVGCEIVGKAVELVVDAIKLAEKVAEKAFNEAKEAARKVEEAAKKVIQAVEEAAKKVEEAVKKAIQSAIDTAKKIGEEIVRVAKEAERIAKEIAKKAEEVAKKIFEEAKEAAKNVVKKIKKIFGRRELEEKFSLTDGNKHPYLVAYGHRRLDTCEDICEKGVEFTCEVGSEVIIPRYLEVIPSFTISDILRGIDMSLSAIGIDKLIDEATRKIFEGIALPSLLNFAKEKLVFPNIEKELSKELKQGIAKIALPKEYQCYISNKFDMNKLLTCVPFNDLKSTWDSMFNQGVGTKCDVSLTCNPLSTSKCLGGRCCSSSAVMPPNCAACDDKGICSKCIDTMYLSTSPQIECKSRKLEGANCSSDDECQVGNACKNGLCCGKSCGVCNEGIEYYDGSSCVPKLLGGNSCTQNKQCKSNVCTSSTGVCCKESDNNCQSCSTGNGICTACKLSTHQLIQGACYEKRSPGDSCLTLNSTLYASSCSSSVCLNGRCCKSSLIKNCLSCSSIDGECKECQSGYFLQYKSGYSQCISKLSALSVCSNNDECQSNLCSGGICCSMTASFKSGCASCNSTGTCTGCMKGYFLLQDVCQANLEDGSSCSSSSICNSGSCLERCCSVGKSSKCKTCGPNGNCLECNTGYFVNQLGSCEMVGGAGSTCNVHQDCASLNCQTGKCCKSSNKSCDACNSLGECTSCLASTHYLLSGECQTKKSTGEVCNDLVLGMCEGSTCKGGRCCSKSNGDTCKTCNSSGLCDTCTEDYYLSNGQCIKKMTSGPCINDNQCLYGQCKGKYCCNPDGSVNECIACDSASLCSSCSIGVPDGGKCKILEKGKDCNSNSQCGSSSCKGNYCCAASEPFCNKCSSGEGSCNGCISGYDLVDAVCLGIKAAKTISWSGLEGNLAPIVASAADRAGMGAIDVSTKIFEDLPGTYFNVVSRNIYHFGGYAIGWGTFRKLDTVYYFHIFSITHYASGLSFNPTPNDGHSDLVLNGIGAVDRNKFVEALDKVGSDITAIASNLFERFGGTYFFAVIQNTPNGDEFTGTYAWAWGSFRKNGEQYSFHCWSISHHKPI